MNAHRTDPELWDFIDKEVERQQNTIDLIPSENICPPEILAVLGTPLVNKYSEGYPGKRYYPGNEYYDRIENLAINRAKESFGLSGDQWHVNVQPYSGSPANAEIYLALMNLGDTLMGMRLDAGGHLTHGHKVSVTGIAYKAVQYGVSLQTELLDYDEIERLAKEHKPKVIVSGVTAYPRSIDFKRFREIADAVGAYHVADVSHVAGLIIGGVYPSPFEYADVVMTTTHKTLRGPRGAVIFSKRSVTGKDGKSISDLIDRAVFPGMQGGPHNNQTAGIALMFHLAQQPEYRSYQGQVVKNASALAASLQEYGFDLFTGGTDSHMMLVKLKTKNLEGGEAEQLLEAVGIIANRNSVPGDPSPFKPSGIRMGMPSVTSRGMKEPEMRLVAGLIDRALTRRGPSDKIRAAMLELCNRFPIQ